MTEGRSPSRRLLGRSAWLGAALLVLSLAGVALAFAKAPSLRVTSRHPLSANGPSLASLDRALRLADGFIAPLYRPLDGRWSVTSEYYGFPLRLRLSDGRWLLLGHSGASVSATESSRANESFRVSFSDGAQGSLDVAVAIEWRYRPTEYRVRLDRLAGSSSGLKGVLYLGHVRLGATGDQPARSWIIVLPRSDRSLLGSFRYTVRHGAQLAQNYYRYVGDETRYRRTASFIGDHGFLLNADLTGPIWGEGTGFGNNLPYDDRLSFHDCHAHLPSTSVAYPYQSKVCSTSRRLYIWLEHSDPLGPSVQALHALERDRTPDRKIESPRLALALPVGADIAARHQAPSSPRQIAGWLEGIFRNTQVGIGRCLPAICERSVASAIRTFQFGALETLLGYRFNDAISRSYADAVASTALKVQVRTDGLVHTDRGEFDRPSAVGSFYLAWNRRLRAHTGASLADSISRDFNMPPEYTGLVVSNAETTLSAYAFLAAYRCARYHVGCHGPLGREFEAAD